MAFSYNSGRALRLQMSANDIIAGTKVRFDRFNVDLSTGKLQRSGLNVPIQAQPFQVLRLLLIADGQVVSRDQLRAALWPEDTFVDSRPLCSSLFKVEL
jgi:DNA-binding winged helix-turn-helix (wHTH) protein